jgi:hypothetical protein
MPAPSKPPQPIEQKLKSLESHVQAIDRVIDASTWTAQAKALAIGLGVLAATLILPWVRGGDDLALEPDEIVRGFELTPSAISPLPEDVATLGAVAFWFLLLVTVPAIVYALRGGGGPAVLAAAGQTVLLGWFSWQAVVAAADFEGNRTADPASGLVLVWATVVVVGIVALMKWVDDRRR